MKVSPLLSRFPIAFHWPLCLEKLSLDVPLAAKAASSRSIERMVFQTTLYVDYVDYASVLEEVLYHANTS